MKPVRKSGGNVGADNNRRGWGSLGASGTVSNGGRSASSNHHPSTTTRPVPNHRRPRSVNPVSPPTTIELCGVPIHFPFQPYKCQEDYMSVVLNALIRKENALLESPTGTGKTLCLLCACLAWQREQARKIRDELAAATATEAHPSSQPAQPTSQSTVKRVPTIIYASRTHSQLSQVVRELRNTRYRPRHAVLGSREQMCVNPKVKKATSTASTVNHDCSVLNKERKCAYKNRLDGFSAPSNESSTGAWYGTQPVMDMEDLVTMGNNHKVCPFYYTRNLVDDAELILLPYNYLFDKDSRASTLADIPWKESVVIFDEAHNLESFASESASFDLSSKDIGGCMSEVDKAITYIESDPDRFGGYIKRDHLLRLKLIFMNLEEYIMTKLPVNQTAYRGEKMMDIFEKGSSITYTNYKLILDLIKKLLDVFMEIRGGNTKGAPRLEHFSQCLKRVFGESSESRCFAKAESYRVHVSPPQSSAPPLGGYRGGGNDNVGRTVSYWCFAPSEAMRELQQLEVRSILVTSGTLSPLESYAIELGIDFPHRLENPHIISPDQIHVRIIGRGVSNKILNSSYERRQDSEYYIELGNTLATLSRVIPGGMLVFFPSYGVMETAIERWGGPAARSNNNTSGVHNFFAKRQRKPSGSSARYSFPQQSLDATSSSSNSSTPWKRLLSNKAVIIEPKTSSDLPDAIEEFHKYLNLPKSKGVTLFGVCRGKISEGIDFANDMCRAVIITGLPFAPSFDPKVKMKREFLDQNKAKQYAKATATKATADEGGFKENESKKSGPSLSGHEWYQQQAHRAVNQAVGRVIRNKRDYGAVLLLDSRFALPGNQNGLSKWVRPHVLPDEGYGRANHALVQFYKKARALDAERVQKLNEDRPTNVSRILEYENEGKENNHIETLVDDEEYTNVAFIDRANTEIQKDGISGGNGTSPSKSYVPPQQIIATVDVTTSEGSRMASRLIKDRVHNNEISSLSVSSSQSSQHTQDLNETKPLVFKTPSSSTEREEPNEKLKKPAETPAKRFFDAVQKTMSREELDSIKKAIVRMKSNTRLKDQKDFIEAFRSIIGIILTHDRLENKSKGKKPELLMLILQLLPKHFVNAGRECTLDLVFQQTLIRQELESNLSEEKYSKVHNNLVAFLTGLWFDEKRIDDQIVATELSRIFDPLIQNGNVTSAALMTLSKVVPAEAKRITSAMVAEMMKSKPARGQSFEIESGKRNIGTHSGHRPNDSALRDRGRQVSSTPTSSHSKAIPRGMEVANYSNSTKSQNKSIDQSLESRKRGFEQNDRAADSKSSTSFKKILKQSEAEIYTGQKKKTISDFPSNAPEDMYCTICANSMEEPIVNRCGHMACSNCWNGWLKKTASCPHCREPVDRKTLAKAIFKGKT